MKCTNVLKAQFIKITQEEIENVTSLIAIIGIYIVTKNLF